jgi:hypothetical protein
MTAMADQYDGNFLCGIDLPRPTNVEISAVVQPGTERDAAGSLIKEAILEFKGARKRLVLNKVNWRIISSIHGKDETKWAGKTITLACRFLKEFMGHPNVACVRVIPPRGTAISMGVVKFMGSATPYPTEG